MAKSKKKPLSQLEFERATRKYMLENSIGFRRSIVLHKAKHKYCRKRNKNKEDNEQNQ